MIDFDDALRNFYYALKELKFAYSNEFKDCFNRLNNDCRVFVDGTILTLVPRYYTGEEVPGVVQVDLSGYKDDDLENGYSVWKQYRDMCAALKYAESEDFQKFVDDLK